MILESLTKSLRHEVGAKCSGFIRFQVGFGQPMSWPHGDRGEPAGRAGFRHGVLFSYSEEAYLISMVRTQLPKKTLLR